MRSAGASVPSKREGAFSGVGQRDDLHRDLAARGDELVEGGEVAVDGSHADARARRDVVPAGRGDALLVWSSRVASMIRCRVCAAAEALRVMSMFAETFA